MGKLPDKLSELIRVALDDLEQVEHDPNYRVDMNDWIRYNKTDDVCEVCFAGATMVKTLKLDHTVQFGLLSPDTMRKMESLDWVRCGSVRTAVQRFMDIPFSDYAYYQIEHVSVVDYDLHPDIWRIQMHVIANYLERNGL